MGKAKILGNLVTRGFKEWAQYEIIIIFTALHPFVGPWLLFL
jgi:hypothetical protein